MAKKPSRKLFSSFTILAMLIVAFSIVLFYTLNKNTIYRGVKVSDIDLSGLSRIQADRLLDKEIKSDLDSKKIVVYNDKNQKEISMNKDQFKIDKTNALNEAWNYGRNGNYFSRLSSIFKAMTNPVNIPLKINIDKNKLTEKLEMVKMSIDRSPENAYVGYKQGKPYVIPEKLGFKLDTEELVFELEKRMSENKENIIKLKAEELKPEIKSDMLTKVTKKIAEFQSSFVNTNKERNNNMIMACKRINGTLLMPGEVFSMNKAVGPRSLSNGFKEAKIIINNELVDGIGGGVCQVSSTLYNVVLLSNLQVIERRAHSLPLLYVPAGRDATISGSDLDFRFKNNKSYPVSINAEVNGNKIRIALFGKDDGEDGQVKLESIKSQIMEPDFEELIFDDHMYKGDEKQIQKAVNGYRARVYRYIYSKDGSLIKKEFISDNVYSPIRAKIKIGIK